MKNKMRFIVLLFCTGALFFSAANAYAKGSGDPQSIDIAEESHATDHHIYEPEFPFWHPDPLMPEPEPMPLPELLPPPEPEPPRPDNPFTPGGQATVTDHATDGDGKEFFTFTTLNNKKNP